MTTTQKINAVVPWGLMGLALMGLTVLPSTGGATPAQVPGYIALGDSIEYGTGDDDGLGYVVPFGAALGIDVEVHNLSSDQGVETRDIAFEQLPTAIVEAQNHRQFGVVVSWGGGGNNLRHFIASPQAATCLQVVSCLARLNALLNEMEQTIDLTVKTLRFFAGSDAVILMRTQYNPLARSGCAPPELVTLADAVLEGEAGILARGLNDRIRTVATRYGAAVVEIFETFRATPDGLISSDCIHPNGAGYDAILEAFTAAVTP